MKTLVCPISTQRIDGNVARITAFLMAAMIVLYAFTGNIYLVIAVAIDYLIRAFTPAKYSPFSGLAYEITRFFNLPEKRIDKAPKIFAARVGFLFALATVILYYVDPITSLIIGLLLMSFALLESVLDLCIGCKVYTYIVQPIFRKS